jgi:hypothetical protein
VSSLQPDPKIALGYVHPGHVTHAFMRSVMEWRRVNPTSPILPLRSGPNISRARNWIVAAFLEKTDAEALFFVDTDMLFESTCDRQLFLDEVDVVSADCVGMNEDQTTFHPASVRLTDGSLAHIESQSITGMVKVVAGGTGAILIRREVLQMLECGPLSPFSDHDWGPPIGVTGHDVTFGLRAEEEGFTNWVDTRVKVAHVKDTILWP